MTTTTLTRMIKTAAVLSASLAGLAIWWVPAARGTTGQSATAVIWLVKGQDLEPWCAGSDPNVAECTSANPGVQSIGLLQDAANDGVTLPSVKYRLCGQWNGTIYGKSDYTNCQPGDTLVVEDYNKLQQAVTDGVFTTGGLRTAVYDIETWTLTPKAQSSDPVPAIQMAAGIAQDAGVNLIVSPGGGLASCSACWDAAAQYGALGVAIQSQGWGWDSTTGSWDTTTWCDDTATAAADVRATRLTYGTSTFAMLGLGTDTPIIHTVAVLQDEYSCATQSESIDHFWMNANNWGSENKCNASDGGPGCPEKAVQFWEREGLIGSRVATPRTDRGLRGI